VGFIARGRSWPGPVCPLFFKDDRMLRYFPQL
jgi:hypothetical protein